MSVGGVAYRRVARPVLFRMGKGDPEVVHHRTLSALARVSRSAPALRLLGGLRRRHPSPRTVFGVDFPSAVGLAAGMDKDGVALKAWPALGFGHVEVGTVTAHPQPGNPRPRLFRLPASGAIINRMGFNNSGAQALAARLATTGRIGVPLGISLGKSKITPVDEAVGDYLTSLRAVYPFADYIAVNVSSPNTPGLRTLQDRAPLDELLAALTTEAGSLAWSLGQRRTPVPVLVKIAPDLTDQAIADLLEVCVDRGIAGLIATNTTLTRPGLAAGDAATAAEAGGLSGRPLAPRSLEVVRFVTAHCDLPVIGVGGIGTVDDGLRMLDAGASLLQLYTGFIFGGPPLVTSLNKAIAAR
ncbi:dihydroorotate dehydrogenase [Nakamurella multipartita DSM 44233]|jgi:dihydroorotate dehydrogenase|uniref:Dihydroorotate dehydrogenase (quinone) n=1 Tax=Nakamurella multipartita (strain ATCC 700099 / DSM 44233 / CIP 104796 / JCM 9543 / NBRC 105858 / Y-104) TaxID=479431 RepID=C8XJK1_NAKMY|nr:quinone-dependent dihydroorotate dehydrogenase [Nakamurella multipartita]ACV80562.1 dihydroorotate dehydrogenase [Nakamurella multipartita DSM 44233]